MKKVVLIILGFIFAIVILSFLSFVGFSKVSTNKDIYEVGEEIVVPFSDFRLLRCNTGPNINFYYKTSEDWDKITHTAPITFGRSYCVDGKLTPGAYPADVVSCCILCRPFLSGEYIWPSQIYEKKAEKEICGDIPEPVISYELKSAPPGKYKIEFGNAQKTFEIKEIIPPEVEIPEEVPPEEVPPDETAKCSTIDFPDYEIAKEFKVDLNNDRKEEILRVYWKIANKYGERVGPIMVKIFSGTEDCPKESFSYQGRGNLVWGAQVFSNFWGDGSSAVMVKDASYGGGCGGTTRLIFLTYREEKYSVIEGPQFGGLGGLYMFDGENGLGKKIIVAEERWASDPSDYCCGCASRRQFMIYTWNGEGYTKTVAGITQNNYSPGESIDKILEKEPSVLNPQ